MTVIGTCPICLRENLRLAGHHIHPINYGGDEDVPPELMLDLCDTCHQNIHQTAITLMSKNPKFKNHTFTNDEELKRASPYIQAILDAKAWFDNQPQGTKPRRQMVVLHISDKDWHRLHKRKVDLGFKSMSKFLHALINRELNQV